MIAQIYISVKSQQVLFSFLWLILLSNTVLCVSVCVRGKGCLCQIPVEMPHIVMSLGLIGYISTKRGLTAAPEDWQQLQTAVKHLRAWHPPSPVHFKEITANVTASLVKLVRQQEISDTLPLDTHLCFSPILSMTSLTSFLIGQSACQHDTLTNDGLCGAWWFGEWFGAGEYGRCRAVAMATVDAHRYHDSV